LRCGREQPLRRGRLIDECGVPWQIHLGLGEMPQDPDAG
jgi:hypothetical protein